MAQEEAFQNFKWHLDKNLIIKKVMLENSKLATVSSWNIEKKSFTKSKLWKQ